MSKPIDTHEVERYFRAKAETERDYGRKKHAADWDARADAIRQERERAERLASLLKFARQHLPEAFWWETYTTTGTGEAPAEIVYQQDVEGTNHD